MNQFQLECFASLADSLNFTKSASSLYITQPALSRTIAALESELGVQLLVRTSHSVRLTAAGESFAKDCPNILQACRDSLERARKAKEGCLGSIRLGFQCDTFEYFIVDLIRRFRCQYPDISLELVPLSVSELLINYGAGALDAVIAAGQPRLKTSQRVLLNTRRECAVFPLDHPLAGRSSIRMEELKNEQFIVMSRSASTFGYERLLQQALDAGFSPHIISQVDHVPSVMMMVACGQGIAILYEDLSAYSYDRLRFVPLENVEPFPRYLMWDEQSENPCLKFLIEVARAQYESQKHLESDGE